LNAYDAKREVSAGGVNGGEIQYGNTRTVKAATPRQPVEPPAQPDKPQGKPGIRQYNVLSIPKNKGSQLTL